MKVQNTTRRLMALALKRGPGRVVVSTPPPVSDGHDDASQDDKATPWVAA